MINNNNDHIEYVIEQRKETQALVIGVSSKGTRLRRMLREMFSGLGISHSSGGVVPTFASAGQDVDYLIVDLHGKNAAETAYNTWLARPHIIVVDENNDHALDGMDSGGIVVYSSDNEASGAIREAAIESGCAGIFMAGEDDGCAAKLHNFIEAGNGTRAEFEVLGEKVSMGMIPSGNDTDYILLSLLTAGICGFNSGKSASALLPSIKERPWSRNEGNLILFDAEKSANHEESFKVLAMVDPGKGRRRVAFLENVGGKSKVPGQFALPVKTSNLDLVYMGSGENGSDKSGRFSSGIASGMGVGEIVTDVLSPGDILKIRSALGKGMDTMIEALRLFPEHLLKGQDTGYAV